MSQLLCRLCYSTRTEYFSINEEFRLKVEKFLQVSITENVLICKPCTEQLESFDQFYHSIHERQQKFIKEQAEQKENQPEVKYIILLKNNQSEIQINEVEEVSDGEAQVDVFELPAVDQSNFLERKEECHQAEAIDNATDQTPCTLNLEGFPKELLKDGKLLVKRKELSRLIARFYKLECHLCSRTKKFKKLSVMMNHFESEHSTKGFVTCCGSKIEKIRQIALHMARHIQPDAFQCPTCNKMLTCPKILQYHIQNHLPEHERKIACSEPGCKRRFSYQSALATHSISHMTETERTSLPCEICERKFSTSGRLSAHVKTVHEQNTVRKEFTCEICSKKFLCKSNLSYHLTTHKNFEFQVECQICKKWLKNKICLRKHMTIHSDVKHFCDICEYSAANKQCLMNHKRIHHSDFKPFTCQICSQSFKLKNTLMNHVNAQHNGLRKYSCEFCTKTFVSSGNYYSHRKRMHPDELSKKLKEKEIHEQKQRTEVQQRKLIAK